MLMQQDSSIAPIQNTASGAAQTNTATLAATAGKTNYLEGFDISGGGATAAAVIEVSITGLASALKFEMAVAAGAAANVNPLAPGYYSVRFPEPLPASGVNVAIAIAVPSFGTGNTNAAVTAYGYQK
jgi:hypothetical protein